MFSRLDLWKFVERGGNGHNADGSFPPTDGRGCPTCGAIRGGGHGGGCPNQAYTYDEEGHCLGRRYRSYPR
jgi:hypothetical protein